MSRWTWTEIPPLLAASSAARRRAFWQITNELTRRAQAQAVVIHAGADGILPDNVLREVRRALYETTFAPRAA